MRCNQAEDLMNLALGSELLPQESTDFYRHIADCRYCAEEYAQLGKLVKEVRESKAPEPPFGYWDDVWRGVRNQVSSNHKQRSWFSGSLRFRLAAVVAPILLVGALLGVRYTQSPAPEGMAMSEASNRHAVVTMHQPYGDPGLAMLAESEGTLASYDAEKHDK